MKVVRGQTRWKDRASEEMRTVYLRDLGVRLLLELVTVSIFTIDRPRAFNSVGEWGTSHICSPQSSSMLETPLILDNSFGPGVNSVIKHLSTYIISNIFLPWDYSPYLQTQPGVSGCGELLQRGSGFMLIFIACGGLCRF